MASLSLSLSAGCVHVCEEGKPHACSARWCLLLRYPPCEGLTHTLARSFTPLHVRVTVCDGLHLSPLHLCEKKSGMKPIHFTTFLPFVCFSSSLSYTNTNTHSAHTLISWSIDNWVIQRSISVSYVPMTELKHRRLNSRIDRSVYLI